MLTAPVASGIAMDSLRAGTTVRVLGRYADYFLVRRDDSTAGWISRAGFAGTRAVAGAPSPATVNLLAPAASLRHANVPLHSLLSAVRKRR